MQLLKVPAWIVAADISRDSLTSSTAWRRGTAQTRWIVDLFTRRRWSSYQPDGRNQCERWSQLQTRCWCKRTIEYGSFPSLLFVKREHCETIAISTILIRVAWIRVYTMENQNNWRNKINTMTNNKKLLLDMHITLSFLPWRLTTFRFKL